MFMGMEVIDAEGPNEFRKRIDLDKNFEPAAFARWAS
jgi:hypothetical protein